MGYKAKLIANSIITEEVIIKRGSKATIKISKLISIPLKYHHRNNSTYYKSTDKTTYPDRYPKSFLFVLSFLKGILYIFFIHIFFPFSKYKKSYYKRTLDKISFYFFYHFVYYFYFLFISYFQYRNIIRIINSVIIQSYTFCRIIFIHIGINNLIFIWKIF